MNKLIPIFTDNQGLEDRFEIIDAILRFTHAMDTHNWIMLRECFVDQLDVDYSAFRGEKRHIVAADDFVAQRAKDSAGLCTQHISTNHLVSIQGNQAECNSCFLIHRIDPARTSDENAYDTAGHYTHGLVRTPNGWRIDRIKQTVLWSRGNRDVHGALRRH